MKLIIPDLLKRGQKIFFINETPERCKYKVEGNVRLSNLWCIFNKFSSSLPMVNFKTLIFE